LQDQAETTSTLTEFTKCVIISHTLHVLVARCPKKKKYERNPLFRHNPHHPLSDRMEDIEARCCVAP